MAVCVHVCVWASTYVYVDDQGLHIQAGVYEEKQTSCRDRVNVNYFDCLHYMAFSLKQSLGKDDH